MDFFHFLSVCLSISFLEIGNKYSFASACKTENAICDRQICTEFAVENDYAQNVAFVTICGQLSVMYFYSILCFLFFTFALHYEKQRLSFLALGISKRVF